MTPKRLDFPFNCGFRRPRKASFSAKDAASNRLAGVGEAAQ
jgi:hypothetical protein